MKTRKLTEGDISFKSEVRGSMDWPNRIRAYGCLIGLSCVGHTIWVNENFNPPVVKAQMMLELHRKLVEHLKKTRKFIDEDQHEYT
jgi:hypothetical protein